MSNVISATNELPPMDRLWTIHEVAMFLNVSERSVLRWRDIGFGPPAYAVGMQLRWNPQEVATWSEANRLQLSDWTTT